MSRLGFVDDLRDVSRVLRAGLVVGEHGGPGIIVLSGVELAEMGSHSLRHYVRLPTTIRETGTTREAKPCAPSRRSGVCHLIWVHSQFSLHLGDELRPERRSVNLVGSSLVTPETNGSLDADEAWHLGHPFGGLDCGEDRSRVGVAFLDNLC